MNIFKALENFLSPFKGQFNGVQGQGFGLALRLDGADTQRGSSWEPRTFPGKDPMITFF